MVILEVVVKGVGDGCAGEDEVEGIEMGGELKEETSSAVILPVLGAGVRGMDGLGLR
jgi:hypothetical protein